MSDNALIQSLRKRIANLEAERDDLRSLLHKLRAATQKNPDLERQDLPMLLRAIARGTQAQENKHDIVFNAAAHLIEEQEAEIGALNRHNIELRGAVDALLQPAPSELLAKNLAHPSRQTLDKAEHDGT